MTHDIPHDPRCVMPPPELAERTRALILTAGIRRAAAVTGVARHTLLTVAAGLHVMPATISHVAERLRALADDPPEK